MSDRSHTPEAQPRGGRLRRFLKGAVIYAGIIAVTLVIVDLILIGLNLFPPKYTPGDPQLGWISGEPTGHMQTVRCLEYSTNTHWTYTRNEDGIRTELSSAVLREDTSGIKLAVGGDSQTDLCAPNSAVHWGVMERELRARNIPVRVFAYPAGKYSPLQQYLALKKSIADYHADGLILNVYTGNDIFDMLRLDDRPYFVKTASGYRIAPPQWYQEDPPGEHHRSRVLFAFRSVAKATGLRNIWVRLLYLRDVARDQHQGLGAVMRYMNDLRESASGDIGYPGAFLAQMLNQQLFFHRFPGSRAESLDRFRALLRMAKAEQPGKLLFLSPLPSYELSQQQPVDTALLKVIARLPVTYDGGVREERELYEALREMAREEGWMFIDNFQPIRSYTGTRRLYNDFDYHLLPEASEIIGRNEADAIAAYLRSPNSPKSAQRK